MRPASKGKSRAGRPSGRFTQHRRLDKLREVLEANPNGLDIDTLAGMLRVTTRSVRRYLNELDRQTELESVATKPGGAHIWRIKPSERGRAVTLRRTQAYGLLATRPLFEALRGSALYDEIDVIMRQLLLVAKRPTRAGVKGEVPGDLRLDERFVFLPKGHRPYGAKGEELDDVFEAVANARVLRFRYRGAPGSGDGSLPERFIVEPYALVLQEGVLVCLARDRARNEVSAFAVERMSETVVREDETFSVPPNFDIAAYTQGAFGLGQGPTTRVIVEFDARVADELRGVRLHPSQKVATAPDGRMRVSLLVPDLDAVVPWVLGFGAAAHVVEPPELARAVAASLRAALLRYGG